MKKAIGGETMRDWVSESGLNCVVILVEHLGVNNGYVKIPKTHPYFEIDYDHKSLQNISVHGGLTYSGDLFNDGDWWLGFDTAHSRDIIPKYKNTPADLLNNKATFKDVDYVSTECEDLAKQIATVPCVN